ncbi:MAG: phosphate signaling complex protein PhoU [Selenomonadaceae bacterium]|nr:phosphate signaling complex protein PhoU [Selenomonadaceae bacterium]
MHEKTRKEYIKALQIVQQKVNEMGELAHIAVDKSMQALFSGDVKLAEKVMADDDIIDDYIIDIEDYCLLLIAKQQPIAHDLRVIATGFKISTDIERIGDHAFDIARTVENVRIPPDKTLIKIIRELSSCALDMVAKSLEAYKNRDVKLADEVRHTDKAMDDIFARTFYTLSDLVNDETIDRKKIIPLLFIARFLERIGDHAVNIAEWVIYLETAERIHQRNFNNRV